MRELMKGLGLAALAALFLVALGSLAQREAVGQIAGAYDLATLGMIPDTDGRLWFTEIPAGRGDVKPSPQYRIIPYTSNRLSGQALHPDGHGKVLEIIRAAAEDLRVTMTYRSTAGLAGGYLAVVHGPSRDVEINMLIVALDHMRHGGAHARQEVRRRLDQDGAWR